MRNLILIPVVIVILLAMYCGCFAGGPPLTITRSNDSVILTWPQTNGGWRLIETDGLDYCYVSNDVAHCEVYLQKLISTQLYATNGITISVVLPIDYSIKNRFYMLHTNDFPPSP